MVSSDSTSPSLSRVQENGGCESCLLNHAPGTRKINLGEVKGAGVFIWGMAPGRDENNEGQEFVGRSGKLLWEELGRVGIERSKCDVQNVVRCFPTKQDRWPALKMRDPS